MTTNHHTPIANGAAANNETFNAPLSELDTKLTDHETRISDLESEFPAASGNPTEYLDGDGNWTVPAGTGASIDGHVIQDEGIDLPQRAKVNFVGAGVTVTNEAGGTQVSIPADYLTPDGLKEWTEQGSDPSTPASGKWRLYFKAGGLYLIDDAGVVIGPLSASEPTSVTVTTTNVTAVEKRTYNLTIAGLTANRNFVLPAPSRAGVVITVNILDGDDTYFIALIGDTGVTINGGSAATEYKRFRAKGESITFLATSTANWQVISEEAQWDTFTPQVYQNGNVTSSNTYCEYRRVGNLVTVRGALGIASAGTSGEKILVQNLPFSIANHSTTGTYIIGSSSVLDSGVKVYVVAACAYDATTISFFDSGAPDFLGASPAWALANNDTISFTITYKVP